ncbi:MAG: hypothetical protein AAGI34_08560 [Pseudomonadota bacterium]
MPRRRPTALWARLCLIGALLGAAPAESANFWERYFGETPPPEALQDELQAFDESRRSLRDTVSEAVRTLSEIGEYDIEDAEREAEGIRRNIEGVLDSIGDGGSLDSAADSAYAWMRAQKSRVLRRRDLSDAQKTLLVGEWNRNLAEIEQVLEELAAVRARLAVQLRIVSGHEGFLEELLVLGKARIATDTLRDVVTEFRKIAEYFEQLGIEYSAPSN